jgi:two-component system response regulator MprA
MIAPRVLVVEDDPPIARLLARTARLEGAEVTVVGDGLEARDAWAGGSFVLVLLDVTLPGLDGLSLCRERRAAGDRTPVILITARQHAQVAELARDAEIDEILAKPFAYERLVVIMRRYLRAT